MQLSSRAAPLTLPAPSSFLTHLARDTQMPVHCEGAKRGNRGGCQQDMPAMIPLRVSSRIKRAQLVCVLHSLPPTHSHGLLTVSLSHLYTWFPLCILLAGVTWLYCATVIWKRSKHRDACGEEGKGRHSRKRWGLKALIPLWREQQNSHWFLTSQDFSTELCKTKRNRNTLEHCKGKEGLGEGRSKRLIKMENESFQEGGGGSKEADTAVPWQRLCCSIPEPPGEKPGFWAEKRGNLCLLVPAQLFPQPTKLIIPSHVHTQPLWA